MKIKALGSYTRLSASLLIVLALSACASSGGDISKIPSKTGDITSAEGSFTQPIKWEKTKAGCKGQCPKLKVDSLVFPGNALLTQTVDSALASMTGLGDDSPAHHSIHDFEQYFWKIAGPRDEVVLAAHTRYRNKDLTILELGSWQYMTGGAHGISATQFLNWDNQRASILYLNDLLIPGQYAAFEALLKQAHQKWLLTQETALEDMAQYTRIWPFQPSDNVALTDAGVVIKYDAYAIAPYSSGQPELMIPYTQLTGILKPSYLPQ